MLEEVVIDGTDVGEENEPSWVTLFFVGTTQFLTRSSRFFPTCRASSFRGKAKIIYKGGCLQQLSSLFIWYWAGRPDHFFKGWRRRAAGHYRGRTLNKEFYLHGLPRFKSFTTGRYLIVIKIPGKYVPCFSDKNTPFGWHFFTSVVSSFPTSCSGIPSLLAVFSAHSCLPLWIGLVIWVFF